MAQEHKSLKTKQPVFNYRIWLGSYNFILNIMEILFEFILYTITYIKYIWGEHSEATEQYMLEA